MLTVGKGGSWLAGYTQAARNRPLIFQTITL